MLHQHFGNGQRSFPIIAVEMGVVHFQVRNKFSACFLPVTGAHQYKIGCLCKPGKVFMAQVADVHVEIEQGVVPAPGERRCWSSHAVFSIHLRRIAAVACPYRKNAGNCQQDA